MFMRIGRARRGLALLVTLFFMILLYGVAASYCALIPTELKNALRLQDDAEAFYTADSGISDALAQMEFQVSTDHNNFENNQNGTFWVTANGVAPLNSPNPTISNAFLAAADARQLLAVKTWAVKFTDRSEQSYQVVLERWAFKVRGERGPDAYRVVSKALRDGRIRRTVESWCIQKNFANYAYFVDRLPNEIWLDLNTFRINGPYHTNNQVLLSAPSNWSDGQQSSFLSQLSMPAAQAYKDPNLNRVVDGVRWNSYSSAGLPYDSASGAINENRYQRVINGGAPRLHQTAGNIELPADASKIEAAAYGSAIPGSGLTNTYPSSVFGTTSSVNLHISKADGGGAYPMVAAGIVLQGDAAQITLSAPIAADGNGVADDNTNSTMNVTQGSTSANITSVYEKLTLPAGALVNGSTVPTSSPTILSFADNKVGYTVVRDGTSNRYAVYEGVGNGAVYINGNVNGLRGVNRGRKTIATGMDTGTTTAKDKKIWLNGAVTRADTPVNDLDNGNLPTGTRPQGVRDQLGLVSYAVRMKRDDVSNPFVPTRAATSNDAPILLYAAIFAGRANDPNSTDQLLGGGMGTDNYNVGTRGYFRLYGSLTEGTRQVKGTFNPSSPSGGTGYAYQYNYDTNFSYTSPPFFPGTSGFRLASWSEAPFRQQ